MMEDDLAHGRLVEDLPELGGASHPFSLIYPTQRHVPQRVKVLVLQVQSTIAT